MADDKRKSDHELLTDIRAALIMIRKLLIEIRDESRKDREKRWWRR